MQLDLGKKYCGFSLKRGRYIPEQEATLYEFVHDKTGAELCFMDSDIENKLFYAAFKTIPFDDTGVFHILEHSVLCGSELYPVREPFVELLKSSMQTFLNAMTFPDKTVYPCSSRNEKDFLNLTKVYLDAVFAPRCIREENVFLQEGWHWESDENGDRLKGVVFNEMKGAMAGADNVTERSITSLVFPDTCYAFNSGGDPKSIPDLSFETFCKTYATFYHPSNCRLYLDGSVPLEETLSLIDSYLGRFDRLTALPTVKLQKPVSGRKDVYYAINEGEEEEGKAFFTMSRIFSGWEEKEKTAAMLLLLEVLTDSNSSPLKKAILDKELGEDVDVNLDTGTAQNVLSITVQNTDKDKEKAIVEAWDEAVKTIMREGIDTRELEASLAAMEYRLREPSEPKGLYRGITMLDSWLYGGDPALFMEYENLLVLLRERLARNGFDELLKELLSDAEGMCRLWTLPSTTKTAEDEKAENERLADMAAKETSEEKKQRLEKLKALFAWQSTPDSIECLQTLPTLSLADIPEKLYKFPLETSSSKGNTVLMHKVPTSGLVYAHYYFKLTDIPIDNLPFINFLTDLLTELPTKNHPDIRELQRQIKQLTGHIGFTIKTEAKDSAPEKCTPYFSVRLSTVARNVKKAEELLRDILISTDLSDEETIYRVVLQEKEDVRQHIIARGEAAGITAALAPCTARYAVMAKYGGYAYYRFLCDFEESFDTMLGKLRDITNELQQNTFCRERLILSLTATEIPSPELFLDGFKQGNRVDEYICPIMPEKEETGLKIPSPIGFATAGWYFGEDKPSTTGSLSVAAKILSLNTLWNKIRVSGGAYGAGFAARRDNCFSCYSFRDPTPLRSVGVFKELGKELLRWCDGPETPDKYIISTISDMEPLVSSATMADLEDSRYLSEYTYETRVKTRHEMLRTDKEDMRKWAGKLEEFAKDMHTCLVGGEQLISEPGRKIIDL